MLNKQITEAEHIIARNANEANFLMLVVGHSYYDALEKSDARLRRSPTTASAGKTEFKWAVRVPPECNRREAEPRSGEPRKPAQRRSTHASSTT